MAYTMTYTSLLEDVRCYLERGFSEESDPIVFEQLPHLVTLAERRISRELKVEGFIRAVETNLIPGVSVYEKPDRWRTTVSMTVDGKPIFGRVYEFCKAYWPDDTETGSPEFYTEYDYWHWMITPTPATEQTLEILYYEQPRFLDNEFQTNFLTEYAPDLLLYATLLEAAPFLKKDERIQTWQQMYDRAAQALDGEDLKRILDRTANRSET